MGQMALFELCVVIHEDCYWLYWMYESGAVATVIATVTVKNENELKHSIQARSKLYGKPIWIEAEKRAGTGSIHRLIFGRKAAEGNGSGGIFGE